MSCLFEFLLDGFVTVELAVDGNTSALTLAGNRLIAGGEIDDAEARVPQGNAAVWRDPVPLPIRSAMMEALRGTLHGCCGHCVTTGEKRDNSAHSGCLGFSCP